MPPKKKTEALRFDQRLVLSQWLISLFEVADFETLAEWLRPVDLEGYDEENVSRFHRQLVLRLIQPKQLPPDLLLAYDANIVRHWQRITERRTDGPRLYMKYFQYLALLFTEIYLDRYFSARDALLHALNRHVDAFNAGKTAADVVPPFTTDVLNKLAFWMATGSGKTLLMRALACLDSIDTGEILWHGEPIHGDAVPQFRRQAIYLHQRPALIEGTVEENLRLPFTLRIHRQCEFSRERIISLLGHVNRTGAFLERSSRDLSGGEAQIVALLRAIQLQPALLLLDEPTAALDDESMQMIEQLVNDWFEESPSDRAFVWVSHDKEQVARVAGRILAMHDGRLSDPADQNQDQSP